MKPPPTINIQEIYNAASFLRGWYSDQETEVGLILKAIKEEDEEWWVSYHSGWGRRIRNLLRENGYTEEALGVRNLDDIYIVIVEFVIRSMIYSLEHYLRVGTLKFGIRRAVALSEGFYSKQGLK